jgi:peptidyl-prolyl cis-trans isomerase B (cyclophilin B)
VTTPAQPPGWYPDPTGQPQSRYWDGIQWTSSTQFAGLPGPPRGRSTGLVVGLVLGAVLLVLALTAGSVVLFRGVVSSSSSDVLSGSEVVTPPEGVIPPEGESWEGQLSPPTEPRERPAPTMAGACAYYPTRDAAVRPASPPTGGDVVTSGEHEVVLETTRGRIAFTVDAARVPCTLAAVRSLAAGGYFDASPCHRVTTSGIFVLQCGDPSGSGSGGPGYEYDDEGLDQLRGDESYPRGTVAMANSGPDTNGSQFFLVYDDTALPPNYTVLGRITDGLEVVQEVARGGADPENGVGDGPPRTPIGLRSVTVAAR